MAPPVVVEVRGVLPLVSILKLPGVAGGVLLVVDFGVADLDLEPEARAAASDAASDARNPSFAFLAATLARCASSEVTVFVMDATDFAPEVLGAPAAASEAGG